MLVPIAVPQLLGDVLVPTVVVAVLVPIVVALMLGAVVVAPLLGAVIGPIRAVVVAPIIGAVLVQTVTTYVNRNTTNSCLTHAWGGETASAHASKHSPIRHWR